MATTVSQFIVDRLRAWGVRRIYGYPGDGINGVMGALGRAGDIDFVQARHEEMAAFMACGHAKYTGEAGVCLGTAGPGAIHLLNGLYDAKLDRQPVVALLGQVPRAMLGTRCTSRTWTWPPSSGTCATSTCTWSPPPSRCRTRWTGPFASP